MRLTKAETAMVEGCYGEGVAVAMKVLVAIGEAFEAEKMVPISRAHVALSNQEADLWFAEKLVSGGAKCLVPPTVNPGFNLEYFQEVTTISPEDERIIKRTREAYRRLGATLTYNCTPYLENNIPRFGEITAFSESSATPFINSVYGARTNREAAQSALCAAVAGRTPEYGFLLSENRMGDYLVEVKAEMKDDFDYNLLGYCVPLKAGHGTPVFSGLPSQITPESLMNLGAQLNTAGAVSMYHIVGFTPEAPTLKDAFNGGEPSKVVVVTGDDLLEMRQKLSENARRIDFVMLGCPHLSIRQVKEIARLAEGQKFKTEFWVCTSFTTKELAERMGYLDVIAKAGGHVVSDTCIDQPCWHHLKGKVGITDSPKCAYYTKRRGLQFLIRNIPDCVGAAVKGEIDS